MSEGDRELRRQLDEALERARASEAVLASIGAHRDLQETLQRILREAAGICGAEFGFIYAFEFADPLDVPSRPWLGMPDLGMRIVSHGVPDHLIEANQRMLRAGATQLQEGRPLEEVFRPLFAGRVLLERRTIQVSDIQDDPELRTGPIYLGLGVRALLGVPLVREGRYMGTLSLWKRAPGPFEASAIKLVEAFGSQATVAIENARLFNETKNALDRQTAVAEVSKALGGAITDLRALLDQVIRHATRLADAENGFVYQVDGDVLRMTAAFGDKAEPMREWQSQHPIQTSYTGSATGRAFAQARTIHIPDVDRDPTYTYGEAKAIGHFRALLSVPMIREGRPLGVLAMWRTEQRPFTDAQIRIVELFADQALIAIENGRLFSEIQEKSRQLESAGLHLRRFMSSQVADLITSPTGEALLAGHRREITVAFCDLRGFTAFSETAEPEEALAVVRTYHGTVGPLIVEHGGTLEHFEGDGVMVFFNDPVQYEDHALRAVRMTLAMRERMNEHVTMWRKRGHELGFGCGIATGYATLGRIGFEGRYDYGAIGPVTNLAARLGGDAKAGQILISQRTFATIEDLVDVEPIGEITVKGYSRPQAAYNVIRLKERVTA